MIGLGLAPLGTAPLGLGVPDVAADRAVVTSQFATVAPRMDPLTGFIVLDASGSPELANGKEQRILIALKTRLGTSVLAWLGSTLSKIDRITENHTKRVDTAIRSALAFMVDAGEIEIRRVDVQRVGTNGTAVRLSWHDPDTDEDRETEFR